MKYTLRIPEPHTHYVEVTVDCPLAGELFLPVWTPGSYLVREYSRYIEAVTGAVKTAKNRWRLDAPGRVSYRLYCHELSVRTNWVEDAFALLIPAATFMTHPDLLHQPHEIHLEHGYAEVHTALQALPDNRLHARNYDELADSPIYLGSPATHRFEVDGKPHILVNEGECGSWDGPASANATRQIVEQYARMMGGLPYDRYVFLNLLTESGGGLEHASSTVLMASRWAWANLDPPKADPNEAAKPSRHRWLDLVSHEFFHTWNVKRLRPSELGPFDYERENYTSGLWFAEGVTMYYGPLMVRRAGLISQQALLDDLSRTIGQVETTPGRHKQSLAEASFDAWIKYYRPHENSANTTISYYTKGCLVAWILDARIRRASNNAKSLDDAVREAYARFSGSSGFEPRQMYHLLDGFAAAPTQPLVEQAGELDYQEALTWFGLRFAPAPEPKPWLGAVLKNGVVESIADGSPAHASGLAVGDELIALNEFRVTADNLDKLLPTARQATYARRGRLYQTALQIRPEPRHVWQLEPDPQATEAQRRNFALWLQSY